MPSSACDWSSDVCSSDDRKSTRLNSSHDQISYAVFCLKKKIVVEEGRPVTADLGKACDRLQEIGERLRVERARTFAIARRLEPRWRAMIAGAHDTPLPI